MTQRLAAGSTERAPGNGVRRCQSHEISPHQMDDPRRKELERFVHDVFASKHGARVLVHAQPVGHAERRRRDL